MLTRSFKIGMNAGHIVTPVIHVNQYDHDEQWIFTLVDDNGVVYTPSTGGIVGLKADGNVILNAGTVNSSGQVVINETQQMTAAPGDATYELLLDNSTHGCANFTVRVEPKPGDNATYSDSDLSLLQEAIDSTIPANIEAAVQDWMDDNLAPSQWVIDNTLSIAGAAADAKTTGDKLTTLTDTTVTLDDGYIGTGDGQVYPPTGDGQKHSDFIFASLNSHIEATITYNTSHYRLASIYAYDSNKNYVGRLAVVEGGGVTSFKISADVSNESVQFIRLSLNAYNDLANVSLTVLTSTADGLTALDKKIESHTTAINELDIVPVSNQTIGFSKSGANWTLTIPKNLAIINKDVTDFFEFLTLPSNVSIAVNSGESLIYDFTDSAFASVVEANIDMSHRFKVLLYNSYGTLRGEWVRYYESTRINALINDKAVRVDPVSSLQLVFRRNSDNSVTVEVPANINVWNGLSKTVTTINASGKYIVGSRCYLAYNHTAQTLSVYTENEMQALDSNVTILLYNSYGVLSGQWACYGNAYNYEYKTGSVKILAHQGSGLLSSTNLGYSKLDSYIAAWQAGFDMAECDLKFSSDGIPVCCHDATFVDATSGTTITISNSTLATLKACDYYGGTIATLDEVVSLCKTLGMDLEIDQLSTDLTDAQWNSVFAIVKKYRAFDKVIFTANQYTIDRIQTFYENARILLTATSASELQSQLALAETIVTNFNEVIVAFSFGIVEAVNVPTYTQNIDPRVKLCAWVIDYASVALQYIPYVDYITSNKVTYKMIADSIK